MTQNPKFSLEYVASAANWGIFPGSLEEFSEASECISAFITCSKIFQRKIKEECKSVDSTFSILFNAFIETSMPKTLTLYENLAVNSIYGDSGGLQIVTAGKTITEDIKREIYATQKYADLAMCFDVISLASFSLSRTKNERLLTDNKYFNQDEHREAGKATGRNIKEQISYFKSSGAKTKVIIIVQGNTSDDMMVFFDEITKELTEDDYTYIGGIAIADTCIGNGTLESIEMLKAAGKIAKIAHPAVLAQLHILGVGSIIRMKPVTALMKSGYLEKYKKISYDSSKHTNTFSFGRTIINGHTLPLGEFRSQVGVKHFEQVYEYFSEYLSTLTPFSGVHDMLYGDDGDWKYSKIRKRAFSEKDKNKAIAGLVIKACHTFYIIHDFMRCLDLLYKGKHYDIGKDIEDLAITNLKPVKTIEDLDRWIGQYGRVLQSKRIVRKEDHSSLESFFS